MSERVGDLQIIKWSKDSNISLEFIDNIYYLYIIYPNRFETFTTKKKTEIKTMLSHLKKQGLKIPKWEN